MKTAQQPIPAAAPQPRAPDALAATTVGVAGQNTLAYVGSTEFPGREQRAAHASGFTDGASATFTMLGHVKIRCDDTNSSIVRPGIVRQRALHDAFTSLVAEMEDMVVAAAQL